MNQIVFPAGLAPNQDIQIGLASYGVGCGAGFAGVYTNIAAYLNETLYNDFLLNLLNAVPDVGKTNADMTRLLTTLPGRLTIKG